MMSYKKASLDWRGRKVREVMKAKKKTKYLREHKMKEKRRN